MCIDQNTGRPQRRLVGMLDMDGDGRADLVDAEERSFCTHAGCGLQAPYGPPYAGSVRGAWFRNLGDGFAVVPQPLPTWFGGALEEAQDTPSRLADIQWTRGTAPIGHLAYGWSDHGLLRSKAVGSEPTIAYDYDALRRVVDVSTATQDLEARVRE